MLTTPRIVSGTLAILATLQFVTGAAVLAAGSISSTPNPLGVCVHGSGTFKVMHGSATITASSNSNPSVATVSPASVPSGSSFTASGLSVGTTTIGLTDTSSGTGSETINVNGPLSVSSGSSLTFDGTLSNGSGTTSQTFTVSDPTASGVSTTVTASLPASPVIASFSSTSTVLSAQQATASGQATFRVFPIGTSGNSATVNIALSDASNCSLPSAVSVTIKAGALTLSTANLTFNGLGNKNNQTFTAQEFNYDGTLNATTPAGNNVVTVSPTTTTAPGAASTVQYTVTPNAYGKSTITIGDTRQQSQNVSVLVPGGTISLPNSSIAAFGTVNDNTNQFLPATPIRVTGSMETTTTGGANVYVTSPSDIIGSSGDLLKISYLTYNCSTNDGTKNQGGTFTSGHIQLIANTAASNCLAFGNAGGTGQYADLDFNVNLFLDDRTVPADTYSTATGANTQFTVVLSAT